ncbi:hydrolase [Rhodovibrio salinarum]|uniref:Hydrolase n=1 Tax=Rhodovibrio salinarum TaxID=1087 RepID=A0A934QFS9_9PROT|nr:hydrolase [Rhodovibrio salinarum]MBK1695735.1 hydrolase [Rhodovibrio salinarum]
MLLSARDGLLVVVDMQARLVPVLSDPDHVQARVQFLLRAAGQLQVPVVASEQYPKGLGPTVPEVADYLPEGAVVEKMTFSAMREPAFREALEARAAGRRQAVVCGAETHVCVLQTAAELQAAGYATTLVADAVGSRRENDRIAGLDRLRDLGCQIATSEMVVFEWLERAGTDAFRRLAPLIK